MIDIVKADVLAHAPELASFDDAAWADVLAFVNQFTLHTLDSDYDRRLARIYLAAHIIVSVGTASGTGGGPVSGPVTSESAGGVKRTYATISSAASTSTLGTTNFGKQYLEILMTCQVHGPFVI